VEMTESDKPLIYIVHFRYQWTNVLAYNSVILIIPVK
jgi:hypothetical protein